LDEDIRFPSAIQTSSQITAKEYIPDISSDTKLQETSVEGLADDPGISSMALCVARLFW
jgi:hypothetical protein